MPLSEEQTFDVTAKSSGHLEVKRTDIISRDGVEIARSLHRHVVAPGDDTTNEVQMVKDIAAAIWTPEMIEAVLASRALAESLMSRPA